MSSAQPRTFVTAADLEIEHIDGKTHNWYYKEGLGQNGSLVLCRARIVKGAGHAFHTHPEMDEIIYVLEGEMEQWLEKERRILKAGESVYIPRGVVHGCYNLSDAECEFIAILTPSKIGGEFSVDVSGEEPWKSLKG
jgi:quercetin dioxygenase-like cupin family protein